MLIIIALAVHEAAHLIAAFILNIKLDKVKITPFGFNLNADLENIGFISKLALFFAGPAANLCLYVIFKIAGYSRFADANALLAIINMVPVVPLDGGNICRSVMEIFLDMKTVCRYMIMTNTFFITCFLTIIHIQGNYLYFLLIVMALKGILEENRSLIEKNIKRKFNLIKYKRK